jgi:hypothetical protein
MSGKLLWGTFNFSMIKNHNSVRRTSRDFPRRLKLSAPEIAIALALTAAAIVQLLASIGHWGDHKTGAFVADPVVVRVSAR